MTVFHQTCCWFFILGFSLAALTGRAAEPLGAAAGKFENLGPQLSARTLQAAAFTRDPAGRAVVCAVVRSQPAAKLLVADVETGELRHEMDLPGAGGAWAAATASDGSVYIGTEPQGKLFRWVPGEGGVRDLGAALPGETYIWSLASGADGEVFGGTYNGARVFRYAPVDGFSEPVPGAIVPGETYARSIACDPAARKLWVGVGVRAPHLIEIDLKTGGKREWLPEAFPGEQSVYSLSLCGDHLFAMLMPSHRTLVFDRRTRAVVGEVGVSGLYQAASAPSPHDGLIYHVEDGNLKAFDPARPRTPARSVLPVASAQAMTWLPRPGTGPGESLVIFTQAGQLVSYHPPTGRSEVVEIKSPEQPTVIQSLALGPDGRIWMGGFLSGGTAAFDPESGRTRQFKGLSQAEKIEAIGDTLYFGIYPRGRVFEFNPARPWSLADENPRRIGIFENQSRPVALAGAPALGRLFVGMIPEYGLLGGGLAVWDVTTRTWETFTGVVANQSVASLAYAQGLLIGGTTIQGGLGVEPVEKDGRLFLWDPETNKKIFEIAPVPGKGIVSGLTPMADGTVWGFAQGALFVFDLKSRRVIEVRELFQPDFSKRAMWQDGNMVVHPDGNVYAVEDGRFLRIDGRTRVVTVLREVVEKKHTRPIALDRAGRIYLADGVDLWRYTP